MIQEEVMVGTKPTKLITLEVHKEGVNVEIKEELVVSIITNMVIWQVNVATNKKKTIC